MKSLLFSITLSVLLVGCGGSSNSPSSTASSITSLAVISSQPVSSIKSIASSVPSSINSSQQPISSIMSSQQSSSANSAIPFVFRSESFVSGERAPVKLTCDAGEMSPNLTWEITSSDVKSFALVMEDVDAIALVGYPYVHWDIYNIAANVRQIPAGATITSAMPSGSAEGTNSDGVAKYSGPCPPPGTGVHHYFFALYALNKESITVNLGRSLNRAEFEAKYASDIIQKVEITTFYGL